MTWTECIEQFDNSVDAIAYAFLHNESVVGAPSKQWLFKAAAEEYWGPKSTMHYEWHPWNLRGLELLCEWPYLAIIGCANAAKTDLGAIWGLLNWRFDPEHTLVLLTSTTLKDSRKRMWGRVKRYAEAMGADLPAKIIDSQGVIRANIPGKNLSEASSISLIAGEKKNEREAIGKLIGMKNQRIILIADELPELSDALFYAFLSNLSVNPQPQMVGIGNFASIYDPLGEFSRPINGWGTITPDHTEWITERGYCLRYDGLKSPNFEQEKDRWKFIYNRKNLADHRKNLGENSIEFWRMCRSFPCPAGTQDTIYSDADFLAVNAEGKVKFDKDPVKVASLDPAYTHDGDRCPIVFAEYGLVGGIRVLCFTECKLLIEDVTRATEARDFQIARQFKTECEQRQVKPENTCLDSTGAGKPFLSIVHEVWSDQVSGIEFGGAASSIPVFSHDRRPAKDLYANRVSEIWLSAREYLRSGQIKGVFPDLAREMKARQYPKSTERQTVSRRITIESKKQMKNRVGWSPDLADAALGLVDFCRQRFGFLAETGTTSFASIRGRFKELALQYDAVHHNLYRVE